MLPITEWATFSYMNKLIKNLTKLFKKRIVKMAYKINNLLNLINTTYKIDNTLKIGI